MGPSLLSLHVLSGFGGRARSEVIMGHVFPQGALAAITMVGSDGGDGVGRVRARYEPGLEGKHCPIRGGARAQGAGAEAWRVLISSQM